MSRHSCCHSGSPREKPFGPVWYAIACYEVPYLQCEPMIQGERAVVPQNLQVPKLHPRSFACHLCRRFSLSTAARYLSLCVLRRLSTICLSLLPMSAAGCTVSNICGGAGFRVAGPWVLRTPLTSLGGVLGKLTADLGPPDGRLTLRHALLHLCCIHDRFPPHYTTLRVSSSPH